MPQLRLRAQVSAAISVAWLILLPTSRSCLGPSISTVVHLHDGGTSMCVLGDVRMVLLDPCKAHVFHHVSLWHDARQLCLLYVGASAVSLLFDLNSFQAVAMLRRCLLYVVATLDWKCVHVCNGMEQNYVWEEHQLQMQ